MTMMMSLFISLGAFIISSAYGFTMAPFSNHHHYHPVSSSSTTRLFLRTGLQVPILDLLDKETTKSSENDDGDNSKTDNMVCPLPSSHLPDVVATPFLYGMQLDLPIHKLLLQEAMDNNAGILEHDNGPPIYGHLVWKPNSSSSSGNTLVGAIGCTAEILVNAPTTEVTVPMDANMQGAMSLASSSTSEMPPEELLLDEEEEEEELEKNDNVMDPDATPTSNTVLCRGGFRFVIKEVVKTIPYPVAIIDEIEDDAEMGDDDMFADFASDFGSDDDDDDDDKFAHLSTPEVIKEVMQSVQSIMNEKLEKINEKQMSPLEKSILEESGMTVDPNVIEQLQAEEMMAAWEVFQSALIDDIEPKDRKFAIAIMATELADMKNDIRREVVLSRNGDERLRIVLKALDEIVGMARARKMASQITEESDEASRDLKVGTPTLPPWAMTIRKGDRINYFWNEEYGWVSGEVIEEPVNVVDEILLTILFDDGEEHKLPLSAEDKIRWRPGDMNE